MTETEKHSPLTDILYIISLFFLIILMGYTGAKVWNFLYQEDIHKTETIEYAAHNDDISVFVTFDYQTSPIHQHSSMYAIMENKNYDTEALDETVSYYINSIDLTSDAAETELKTLLAKNLTALPVTVSDIDIRTTADMFRKE